MIWAYTGTNAKPAPARPAQRILDVLAELASNPYERDEIGMKQNSPRAVSRRLKFLKFSQPW